MSRLQGKVAIITGGASGFGKGIAEKFVQEGAHVIIADLSNEAGTAVAAQLGNNAQFVQANVTKRSDWENLLKEAVGRFGTLDIVVNNAGTTYENKATEEVTDEDFDKVFDVNVKSVYLSTNVLVPWFVHMGVEAVFLQIASTAGGEFYSSLVCEVDGWMNWRGTDFVHLVRPRPRLTWYNASKAAVINATKAMAVEYGPQQIRFNAVSPVIGSTGMTHLFIGKPDTAENRKAFESTVPLGRGSTPADVANACCYLASDEAAFITGVNLEVDGGRCV
ncbi:3-oxoacyl-reductase [Poronia punctata]|nr:3-oxoacyl-reductase [Poronia punctata]